MPRYRVTIEAKKVMYMDQVIEVEAKNSDDAREEAVKLIERSQIRKSAYEEIGSEVTDEMVTDVEKIKKEK